MCLITLMAAAYAGSKLYKSKDFSGPGMLLLTCVQPPGKNSDSRSWVGGGRGLNPCALGFPYREKGDSGRAKLNKFQVSWSFVWRELCLLCPFLMRCLSLPTSDFHLLTSIKYSNLGFFSSAFFFHFCFHLFQDFFIALD